jgi:prolyl oligopeptidase
VDNVVEQIHGVAVADPYRWLEKAGSPEVQGWVEKQNALTRSLLDRIPGRDRLRQRLDALLDIATLRAPIPARGRYFSTRREGKENQAILYVREGQRGPDRVLLDPGALAPDGGVALDWWYPSPDGKWLAYGVSREGSEQSTLRVRDVTTGKDLPDVIERTRACSLAWRPDGSGFYYTRFPRTAKKGEENYHRHVYLHRLGDDPDNDVQVFGAGRAAEDWPDVRLSPDGRWLVVTVAQGWSHSEVHVRDLRGNKAGFIPLVEGVEALFNVVVRNDRFYVHTNHEAPRYRVFCVDPLRPARALWQEVVGEGPDVLEEIAVVGDRLVGLYLHRASSRLRLFDRDGKHRRDIDLPTLGTIAGLGGEWDGDELLFGFQSFTVPHTIYRIDLKTLKSELWGRARADIDLDAYVVEQVTYPSADRARTPITMFLAHRKGWKPNGKTPALLYGYGGFNLSLTPSFSAARFAFLERGGLIAVANLRGGGEYGAAWHQAGMLGNKQNVFDDFIGAAAWLIQQGYTDRDHLAVQGRSNGGLLVGAVLTQRPELFRAAVCQVPLLDMVRYHRFLIGRLWIPEYGCAEEPEEFRWLYAYSPYHRVKKGTAYPAVLLATAESDTRVDALHARKMTARLQAATSSDHPVLLRLEKKAGHGAGKPRAKVLEELTDVYGFLIWQLGME